MAQKHGSDISYDRPIFGSGKATGGGGGGNIPVRVRRRRLSLQAKMFLFALVALSVIAGVAIVYLRPKESRYVLDNYQVATVGERDFRSMFLTSGRVVPDKTVTVLGPTARSQVQRVHVQPGDDVATGQILLELVSETLIDDLAKSEGERAEAAIELAQARLQAEQENVAKERELSQAHIDLREAEERAAFLQQIYERGGVSKRELEQAQDDVKRKQEQLQTAEHTLAFTQQKGELSTRKAEQKLQTIERQVAMLQDQIAGLTVRAEADGRVLSLAVRVGDVVAQGAELMKVADLSRQHVETAITPEQALEVRPGMQALLRFGSHAVSAVVEFVSPQAMATNEGSAVPVRLALAPEVSQTLVPNTDVNVEIELGMRQGRTALVRGPFFASGDASFVYVVSADGLRANRREVRFGSIDGSVVEVLAGLEPGERIIYSSYSAFRAYPTVELLPEGGRNVEWP